MFFLNKNTLKYNINTYNFYLIINIVVYLLYFVKLFLIYIHMSKLI